jgi:DNA polymerase III delta subunit
LPRVFLLHGPNAVNLDDRVRELRQEFDPTGMGASVLDLTVASLDEVSAACHSVPFFGTGRTVVITNVGKTTGKGTRSSGSSVEWKELLDVLEATPDSSSLILRADEILPTSSVIVKAANRLGWHVEPFPMPRGEELAQWVAERGQMAGVFISRSAAMLLLTRLYPTSWRQESRFDNTQLDSRLIATEVEKLACAAVDGDVDETIVSELVADRSGFTAFKLNDLVYSGQARAALTELDQVLSSGDEPERVIAQFASEAAGLSAARHLPEFDPPSVAKASGISEGRLRVLRQKPAARDPRALTSAIENLRRTEWLVKTGRAPRGEAVIVAAAAEIAEEFRRTR